VENAVKLVVREVFEVLYSPVKAFKKIIEKPDLKGVLLVLVLVVSSFVISEYVVSSKLFIENRLAENDDWTESLTNSHSWVSNGSLLLDDADYQTGNSSVTSSVPNATSIWLKITDFDSINCSGEKDYTELFFWINWTNEAETFPSSGTLKLFSGSEDSYFESDITDLSSSGEWTNTTLKVGPDQGWTSNNSPEWQNITEIEFKLDWSSSANLTMKIDGLFFRKYSSPIITGQFSAQLPFIILQVVLNFVMNWVLWAGILMIVAKLFNEDLGHWNVFFVIIAYSFIVTVVYTLIRAVPFSTLPPLNVPLDADAFTALLGTSWSPLLAYQLWVYIPLIGEVWIAALGAVVVRLMKETTWSKAATIATVAFAINYFLLPIVLSLLQSLLTF
jgi:hypothetical protein